MDSKEDEDISIDFSKVKGFFKRKKENKDVVAAMPDIKNDKDVKTDAKDDEEMSIDFSKVKGFFKGKQESMQKNGSGIDDKKDDEEISFDFSRIKNVFKSDKKESSSDEFSIDLGKTFDFFKKYGILLIVLIPILLSIYIRMQAGFLPFTDDWATNTVMNGIRSQIKSGIGQQYPNLPESNKNALVDTELQKVLSQNKQQISDTIKAYSDSYKSFFQDDNGKNYMPDIDPYYWLRYAQNIINHGNPGDIVVDGKPYDNHQLAPVGRFVTGDVFHEYFLAYFYKFLHIFVPSLTLYRSLFYYPVFVSALCVLLVFLIARRIAGNASGFFAGLMMAVNAAFLGRTLFGHADSDAWVVFFPLLSTWLFIISIDSKNISRILILSFVSGLVNGFFAFAWNGWWYSFDFLLVTMGLTFLYLVLANFSEIRKDWSSILSNHGTRNILIFGVIYLISTIMFVTLFAGWVNFANSFVGPLGFSSIKAPVIGNSIWPNVLTTVAELNEGSINSIIKSIGGPFLFFIGLVGLVLAVSRKDGMKMFDFIYVVVSTAFYGLYFIAKNSGFSITVFGLMAWVMLPIAIRVAISIYKKDHSYDFKLPILLSLWVISTIYASIRGIRFTLLISPAFSVAFGVALGKVYDYFSVFLTKELKVQKVIGCSILIILLLTVYVSPTRGAINTANYDIPIVNDAWYNSLTAIKQDSREDAIITSWWDFGHHFKAIASRPVTFDGTTQPYPAAHWVGKLLMGSDEKEAVGILRMLDCGNYGGFDTLNSYFNDFHKSIKVIDNIILLNRDDAEKELKKYQLSDKKIKEVLSYTHCNPPQAYFIASDDMIGKSGVWAHFGSWNFERADIWLNARKLPQEKAVEYMMKNFNYTRDSAENTYFKMQAIDNEPDANTRDSKANAWIAPWPGYAGTISCSKSENEIYTCQPLDAGNNIQLIFNINLSNYDIYGTVQQQVVRPSVAAFTTDYGLFRKDYNGTTMGYGLTVIPNGDNELKVVVSSKELVGGMFTRMFFMQGHGLKYFKLFDHQRGLTGTDIYVYKVDWEGKDTTIVKEFLAKPASSQADAVNPASSINNTLNTS